MVLVWIVTGHSNNTYFELFTVSVRVFVYKTPSFFLKDSDKKQKEKKKSFDFSMFLGFFGKDSKL